MSEAAFTLVDYEGDELYIWGILKFFTGQPGGGLGLAAIVVMAIGVGLKSALIVLTISLAGAVLIVRLSWWRAGRRIDVSRFAVFRSDGLLFKQLPFRAHPRLPLRRDCLVAVDQRQGFLLSLTGGSRKDWAGVLGPESWSVEVAVDRRGRARWITIAPNDQAPIVDQRALGRP